MEVDAKTYHRTVGIGMGACEYEALGFDTQLLLYWFISVHLQLDSDAELFLKV